MRVQVIPGLAQLPLAEQQKKHGRDQAQDHLRVAERGGGTHPAGSARDAAQPTSELGGSARPTGPRPYKTHCSHREACRQNVPISTDPVRPTRANASGWFWH